DLTGREARVLVRPAADDAAADADHPLAPQRLRELVGLLRHVPVAALVRIEDDLGDPLAVAEIDEDTAAVIAIARDPAEEDDLFALVGGAQFAAVMGAFQLVDEAGHGAARSEERRVGK